LLSREALGKHLHLHRDGGVANARDTRKKRQDVAHPHGLLEDELIHSHRGHAPPGVARRHDGTGNVHLCHDPAAKNIAVGVAVGGHGHHLEHQLLVGGQSHIGCQHRIGVGMDQNRLARVLGVVHGV
jgi:hypothetical protein